MRPSGTLQKIAILLLVVLASAAGAGAAGEWTVVGWNDLGMHCMDAEYSIFSLLPPFNTIHAQVIDSAGRVSQVCPFRAC